MTAIRVHVDSPTGTVPVGTARISRARGVETTEFTYDDDFVAGPGWAVSPDLPIHRRGSVIEGLPGALDDSAPDAWGRNLIAMRLASQAGGAGQPGPPPPSSTVSSASTTSPGRVHSGSASTTTSRSSPRAPTFPRSSGSGRSSTPPDRSPEATTPTTPLQHCSRPDPAHSAVPARRPRSPTEPPCTSPSSRTTTTRGT